jgi:hypothetical protein
VAVAQRAEGVGAALFEGAWISVAYRGGHRIQAVVERFAVGGQHARFYVIGAVAVG